MRDHPSNRYLNDELLMAHFDVLVAATGDLASLNGGGLNANPGSFRI